MTTNEQWIDELLEEAWRQGYYTNNNTNTSHFDLAKQAILQKLQEEDRQARIEAMQWCLNDLNMPDTDTAENIQGFIDELTKKDTHND